MRFNRIFLFLLTFLLIALPFAGCKKADAATVEKTDVDQSNFIDELTFLGDSITAHMQLRASVHPSRVWATKNRYLNLDSRITYAKIVAPDTGEEELIADVAARLTPRYLVITLGIDYGVYYYRDKPDTFRHYYEKLLSSLQAASPETVLILQSIFPVGRNSPVITNEMVQNANRIIREIAGAKELFFVDQTNVLADEEGYLREEFCYSEDGIHLTAAAYSAILSNLSKSEDEIRG
jgi:lysophospholipase L1-like esterase